MLGFLRIGLFGVCRDGGACEASCDASTTALAEEESTTVLGAQPAVTLGPGCGTEDRAMVPSSASATKSRRPSGVQDCICGEAAQADRGGATCDEKVSPIIHEAMSTFVRTLVRGICIEVLLDDGSVIFPQTSLNSEMTHLTLDVNEAQRAIPLQDVESVATSTELRTKNILTSIQPYLDERCCTLVLRGFEFVTFRLDNERHREYFAAFWRSSSPAATMRRCPRWRPLLSIRPMWQQCRLPCLPMLGQVCATAQWQPYRRRKSPTRHLDRPAARGSRCGLPMSGSLC